MLTEGVTEGLSSAGSFGLGKVFDAVKGVFRGERTGYLAEAGVAVLIPKSIKLLNKRGNGWAMM